MVWFQIQVDCHSLHIDKESGETLCEICGELLSSSVDGDVPIKCKSCGLQVKNILIF